MELKESRGIAAFALRNPHFIVVACLIITLLGTLSYLGLPKDLLPAVKSPAVQILSFYPGMPVDDVAANLSSRFELYTGQATGIVRQESRSLNSVSVVRNYFSEDTDLNSAIAQTASLIMSVLRRLPPGTQPPLLLPFDPTATVPIAMVAVSGDKAEKELYDYARYHVITAVQATQGAMAPTVMGGAERQVVIYLDRDKLARYNFSPLEVLNRVTQLNTFIPSGSIKAGSFDYQITSNGIVDKISEMNEFPLRAGLGETVYLNQVGNASDSHKIQTNVVLIDGKPQVYVPVYRQPGANTIQIVDSIRNVIKDLNAHRPDFHLNIVGDQSGFVRKAIESISEEALMGGGMAALLVLVFLGSLRATVAIALSIPLSFLFAFLGLKAIGQTLNAMTLGGLALSVGVLVDNSIVVIENIFKYLEHKTEPTKAALDGANHVALPVLVSTLCTLIVFTPVLFLQGLVKYLFAALAVAVILAMIASYFIAMTVVPLYASRFIRKHEEPKGFFHLVHHFLHELTHKYGNFVKFALARRKLLLGIFGVWFLLCALMAPRVGSELFPKADAGNFILEARMRSGTRIEESTEASKKIEAKLRSWMDPHDLDTILVNVGVYYGFPAAYTPNSGTQDMFFNVQLSETRRKTSQDYAEILRGKLAQEFPEMEFGFQLGGLLSSALNGGVKAPIQITVIGDGEEKRDEIARALVERIRSVPGTRDVRVEERVDAPQVQIVVDRKKAGVLGITTDEVMKNVVSAVSNSSSFNAAIWVDPKSGIDYYLGVQLPEAQFSKLDDILKIPVTGHGQNRSVMLDRLVKLMPKKGPTEISHLDLKPVTQVFASNQGRDIASVSKDINRIIAETRLEPGYEIRIKGEYSQMVDTLRLVGGGFGLALVLVYLLLVVQFRSYSIPLVIVSAVPLGITGLIALFWLTNTYFSIQAAIGAIFLIGIAVANSVLLVEFILHRQASGIPKERAVVEGAMARLRPILMTALAAVMGLLPMAIGLGKGSEANIPLGRAVVGGQLIGVPLMLVLVPVLYAMIAPENMSTESEHVH
jgi:multidrug efflux pump subunit AcrB